MKALLPILLPALSFVLSIWCTTSLIELAIKKKLFEENNALKDHKERVSSLGGIAIFASSWIALGLGNVFPDLHVLSWIFAGSFILFLTGVKDDLVGVHAFLRLLIQMVVATILFVGGIRLCCMPGIEGEIPLFASYGLTLLIMGSMINAFNFIDGVNGLAGGLSAISLVAFSGLFFYLDNQVLGTAALIIAAAVAGFLWFNFGSARIFMGDNGSTFLGVMLSFFLISLVNLTLTDASATGISPWISLAFILIPVADMGKVLFGRLIRRKSPFKGDRTHIHHLLAGLGLGHRAICIWLYSWSLLVIFFALFFLSAQPLVALGTLLVLSGIPYLIMNAVARLLPAGSQSSTKRTEKKDHSLKTQIS